MLDYPCLCKKLFFPALDIANRTNVSKKLAFLEKSQWWSEEQLTDYQNREIRSIIGHAYNNVPYYRRIFKERSIMPQDIKTKEDIEKLPILTKKDVKRNFNDLIAKNHSMMTLHKTSGSTGEPTAFYVDKEAESWKLGCTLRSWKWAGYNLGDRHAQLGVWSRRGRKKVKDILLRCIYLPARKLNEKMIYNYLLTLEKSKVKSLIGVASSLYLLAKYASKWNFRINFNTLVNLGDTLLLHQRKLIEKEFDCKINDTYGLGGESIEIAAQCERNELYHINQEIAFLNFLKVRKSQNLSKIIVTGLRNYAMPLIRYDTGDTCILKKAKCSCGRSFDSIFSINGRLIDNVITPNGTIILNYFFPGLFELVDSIDSFQVIQEVPKEIYIKIIKNDKFRYQDLDFIKKSISKECNNDLRVFFEFVDQIHKPENQKNRYVISKCS